MFGAWQMSDLKHRTGGVSGAKDEKTGSVV